MIERDKSGRAPQQIEVDLLQPIQLILKVPGLSRDLIVDIATREESEKPSTEESYIPTKEDRRRAMTSLSRAGRRYISFSATHEGTKWSGENMGTMSSEAVDRTWDARSRSEEILTASISNALDKGIKLDRVMDSLRQIGMTVIIAETHMGETSGLVQEQVEGAKMIVRREVRRQGRIQ